MIIVDRKSFSDKIAGNRRHRDVVIAVYYISSARIKTI